MMYLLDTNVISELRKLATGRADAKLTAWVNEVRVESCFISVVSVLEIQIGIHLLENREDAAQAKILEVWLHDHVLPAFDGRILPCDTQVALRCAALHVPDPAAERDSWIAATALVHGLMVVTRNTKDFKRTGAVIINPWEGS